jgi:hypothetical protein
LGAKKGLIVVGAAAAVDGTLTLTAAVAQMWADSAGLPWVTSPPKTGSSVADSLQAAVAAAAAAAAAAIGSLAGKTEPEKWPNLNLKTWSGPRSALGVGVAVVAV